MRVVSRSRVHPGSSRERGEHVGGVLLTHGRAGSSRERGEHGAVNVTGSLSTGSSRERGEHAVSFFAAC